MTNTSQLHTLLEDIADFTVHSAEDLPYPLLKGSEVIALFEAFDLVEIEALNEASCLLTKPLSQNTEKQQDKSHPLQGILAIVARSGRPELKAKFNAIDIRKNFGKVTLVGFGPGNPELLTLGGDGALKNADVIFYDQLLDIQYLSVYKAEKINVGKRKDKHSFDQDAINRHLLDAARAGKQVVRLKGGDPMIFAHGGEEIEYLQRNFIEVEVIPGVSAGIAVSSLLKVPLTHRWISSSVAFFSGHSADVPIPKADTLVCYMGGSTIHKIAERAILEGRDPETPVLLVYNVSWNDQTEFETTLSSLVWNDVKFPTPVIIVIGEVVSLRNHSAVKLKKPVYLVTGTHPGHDDKHVKIVHQPLIQIEKIQNNSEIKEIIEKQQPFDWILFTSHYAVQFFREELLNNGKDSRWFSGYKIVSVGNTTSGALKKLGIMPDLQIIDEASVGVIKKMKDKNIKPSKMLIPGSDIGLPVLSKELEQSGWEVRIVTIYQNKMPNGLIPVDLTQINKIVFPFPQCVTNFVRLYGSFPADKEYIFRGYGTEKRFNKLKNMQLQFQD